MPHPQHSLLEDAKVRVWRQDERIGRSWIVTERPSGRDPAAVQAGLKALKPGNRPGMTQPYTGPASLGTAALPRPKSSPRLVQPKGSSRSAQPGQGQLS